MGQVSKRILIIDDSEAIHRDFRRVLCPEASSANKELLRMEEELFGRAAPRESSSEWVFEVDSAFQGEEGFAKVKETVDAGQPYALAILDYRMPPGWNGIETLRRLREVDPSLPVMLCSAYADSAWEQLLREFGESPLLVELKKPFSTEELFERAKSLSALRD